MTLFSTKYPNQERTVSGNYNVDPEDTILLCDTSLAVVTINLATIPANNWNTIYKLYVIDNSGNSATNAITINAPAGTTINGATSLVISTNSGISIIRIASNTAYQSTNSWASGNGHIIADEGTNLTQRPVLNFTGTGVRATDNSVTNRTDVLIGTTNNRVYAVKATSFTPDVRIPSFPITTGQSWILANTSAVTLTNWNQTEATLGGFDPATGGWTVPATGFYNIRIRLYIGAFNDGANGINSIARLEEGDFGKGSFLLGFVNPVTNTVYAFQEFSTNGTSGSYTGTASTIRTSVILIDQIIPRVAFNAAEQFFVKALNKTELAYLIAPNNNISVYQSLTLIIDETI